MYTLHMILHYMRCYRRQYILLAVQMTLAFAIIFAVGSAKNSIDSQVAASDLPDRTSFIVSLQDDTDRDALASLTADFVAAHPERNITVSDLGSMYIIESEQDLDDLYDEYAELLVPLYGTLTLSKQNQRDMLENEGVGVENISQILEFIAAIVTFVTTIGFIGYVMLFLIEREHDILAAYLCGAGLTRQIISTAIETASVGLISAILGVALGSVLAPTLLIFGMSRTRLTITPQPAALLGILVTLIIIYAIPTIICIFRMRRFDPITAIRREEN